MDVGPIYIIRHFFVAKLEYLLFQNLNYDNKNSKMMFKANTNTNIR